MYFSKLKFFDFHRANRRKEPKKLLTPATDQNGSQVNFYYGAPPYAESIAPSHHSTYAHYYDDEEDGWEMPNFYNETYMKESLHNGMNGKMNSLARSNASIYGTKDDLYDRLKRHAYPGKKGKAIFHLIIRIKFLMVVLFQIKVIVTAKQVSRTCSKRSGQ